MKFPLMAKIKQNFDTDTIADIAGEIPSDLNLIYKTPKFYIA